MTHSLKLALELAIQDVLQLLYSVNCTFAQEYGARYCGLQTIS